MPTMDTSSGKSFNGTWRDCSNLICVGDTLDFTKLRKGEDTFIARLKEAFNDLNAVNRY